MFEGMVRILSNCFTTLRSTSLKPNLSPIIVSMTCLSFSIRVGELKGV
jgi:hypothetical protein